jgi:hypothetical protein
VRKQPRAAAELARRTSTDSNIIAVGVGSDERVKIGRTSVARLSTMATRHCRASDGR